jgi:hypothetical protein
MAVSAGMLLLMAANDESSECCPSDLKAAKAFWISPNGAIMSVHRSHINEVIRRPEKFGMTTVEIEEVYRQFKEPLGLEGQAREQIIRHLVTQGWIRIREYRHHVTIHVNTLSGQDTKKRLQRFLECVPRITVTPVRLSLQAKGTIVEVTVSKLYELLQCEHHRRSETQK